MRFVGFPGVKVALGQVSSWAGGRHGVMARRLPHDQSTLQERSRFMSRSNMTPGNFSNFSNNSEDAVRQLNSLLRGEISACETYRMAIDKVSDGDQGAMYNVSILREIETEHEMAA